SRRFQNIRGPGDRDPLAHLEIDPLRALNNLLWGYLQNEPNQLTVKRRAYEYDHHYGLTLYGKAVPALRSADSRSKFIEGFQILLSVRYDDWIELNDENEAKNWARYWRPEIQSYIHGYRTVTGVDLTNPDTVDSTIPAVHLRKRLALQQAR